MDKLPFLKGRSSNSKDFGTSMPVERWAKSRHLQVSDCGLVYRWLRNLEFRVSANERKKHNVHIREHLGQISRYHCMRVIVAETQIFFYKESGIAHRTPARARSLVATLPSVQHGSRTFRALPRPAEWMRSRDIYPWPMSGSGATLAETKTG